ncbi:MAG: NTP transferase domain-containing protein [Pseudomonadales bacterium]|jgi:bifunctional UDP-N-acetylglucosamine pyrophosphorylase/glucosamine-1-phosphate N-acetyltransferase|nr:NTP transferase domain-containing protein [Pseudomonadales bacterium]
MTDKKQHKIEQVVILAAGNSSRMWPLTDSIHKAELEILGKPIIYWTLDNLRENGIKNIIVVIGKEAKSFAKILESYKEQRGARLKIVIQEKPLGMGDAILSCKEHLKEEFFVINSNQLEAAFLMKEMQNFNGDAILACKKTTTPWLYGMVKISNGQVRAVVEKPKTIDDDAKKILGIYRFNDKFVDFLANYIPTEYALEDALNDFCKDHVVKACEIEEEIENTLKYPWHLLNLQKIIMKNMPMTVGDNVTISPQAIIKGRVIIEDGALIGDFALIEGPAYIGRNAIVGRFCTVRANSSLEEGVQIQSYGEVRGSVIMKNSTMHSGFIGDSIIGENCQIGAGIITANLRLDRKNINFKIDSKIKINTDTNRLGTIVGHGCQIGIGVKTMPGVAIKSDSIVMPGEIVKKNLTT